MNILKFFIVVGLISLGFLVSHQALAGTATLNWNANTESDLASYKVYYDITSRTGTAPCANAGYASNINVGNVITYTFNNLTDGITYYFTVSAYDTSGNESACSTQQSKAIPAADTTAPFLSNGSPSGGQPTNTTQVTMSLATDENATCKYSTTAGTAYSSMANTFSTTGATSHSVVISNLSNGQSFNYYVRCLDGSNNANTNDYGISFSVASSASTYTIGGAISGLSGTIVLQNNGSDNLTITANGSFNFSIATTTGKSYVATVLTQPSGQTCAIASGSGTVAGANISNVSVSCSNIVSSASTGSSGGGGGGGGSSSSSDSLLILTSATSTTATSTLPTLTSATSTVTSATSTTLSIAQSQTATSTISTVTSTISSSVIQQSTIALTVSPVFDRALTIGSLGKDIKRLQQLLNSDPDTAIASSGIGSAGSETEFFGPLTEKAIGRFQAKHNIAKAGDIGYGFVGPKTRAKLAEVFGKVQVPTANLQRPIAPAQSSPTATAVSPQPSTAVSQPSITDSQSLNALTAKQTALKSQLDNLRKQLNEILKQLKALRME